MIDLHIHTILSDGTDSVEELLDKLEVKGIDTFAITDHDNISAYNQITNGMQDKIVARGLRYISGVELSCDFGNDTMHILAYNFKDTSSLEYLLDELQEKRLNRVRKRIEILENEFGITLTEDELYWIFSQNNPSKPHIAQVLINKGLSDNINSCIQKYMYHKVPNQKMDAIMVADTLHARNITFGIAHPLGGVGEKRIDVETFEHNVKIMKEHGISFLECYYSLYNAEERKLIKSVADKYGLKVSGGSDYHGLNKDVELGDLGENYAPNAQDISVLKLFN